MDRDDALRRARGPGRGGPRGVPRWARRLGIGVGVVLLTVAAVLGALAVSRSGWPTVQGQVVEVQTQTMGTGSSRRPRYTPTVEYAVDGTTYRWRSTSGGSTPIVIGQPWPVRYDPADPGHVTGSSWWPIAVVGGLGVLFLIGFGVVSRRASS